MFYFYVVTEQHWAACATMSLGAESPRCLVRGAGVSQLLSAVTLGELANVSGEELEVVAALGVSQEVHTGVTVVTPSREVLRHKDHAPNCPAKSSAAYKAEHVGASFLPEPHSVKVSTQRVYTW